MRGGHGSETDQRCLSATEKERKEVTGERNRKSQERDGGQEWTRRLWTHTGTHRHTHAHTFHN